MTRQSDLEQMKVISQNISKLLDEHGLTQAELGTIAGVSESAVSKWISCANAPSMGSIQRIADYFGIPKSMILESRDSQPWASIRHKVLFDRMKNATDEQLAKMEKILDLIEEEERLED